LGFFFLLSEISTKLICFQKADDIPRRKKTDQNNTALFY